MPCGDYAALKDLHDQTVHNCPDANCCGNEKSGSENSSRMAPPPWLNGGTATNSESDSKALRHELEVARASLSHTSRYACCRASPLICPNQGLIEELDIVMQSRSLEGEDRSALSYQRAIAVS